MDRYVLSALVQNHAGVLSRVSGLFSRRGYNIDSLTVGETQEPGVSRMTIVVRGDEATIEQIEKQLEKLVEVGAVRRLDPAKVGLPRACARSRWRHRTEAALISCRSRAYSARASSTSSHDSLTDRGHRRSGEDRRPHRASRALRHSRARQDGHRRPRARTLLAISYLAASAALKGSGGGEQATVNYPLAARVRYPHGGSDHRLPAI